MWGKDHPHFDQQGRIPDYTAKSKRFTQNLSATALCVSRPESAAGVRDAGAQNG
jgi:hypothetical protein